MQQNVENVARDCRITGNSKTGYPFLYRLSSVIAGIFFPFLIDINDLRISPTNRNCIFNKFIGSISISTTVDRISFTKNEYKINLIRSSYVKVISNQFNVFFGDRYMGAVRHVSILIDSILLTLCKFFK